MNEEKKITSQFDNDPIAKLRARELDLRAQENARKEKEGEDRLNLDKMKAMMAQENQDEKLEQNEELAKLRADTSIQKTILGKTLPNADQMIPKVDIIREWTKNRKKLKKRIGKSDKKVKNKTSYRKEIKNGKTK